MQHVVYGISFVLIIKVLTIQILYSSKFVQVKVLLPKQEYLLCEKVFFL